VVTIGGTPLDFAGPLVSASGVATLNILGFVRGKVGFSFEQKPVDVDVNADGFFFPSTPTGPGSIRGPPSFPDVHSATLTTLGLSILPDDHDASNGSEGLFIGVPGSVGLSVASRSLALAL